MESDERIVIQSEPLLACCLCDGLLQRTVLLSCLHNYCQRCFSEATSKDSRADVQCKKCGEITHSGDEQPNRFLDLQVKRYTAMAESGTCGTCKERGLHEKLAAVWCPECGHSLCSDCSPAHLALYRNHRTQPLKELKSSMPMRLESSASADCLVHNRPLEIACFNCEKVKCLSCWSECYKNKHQMHVVYDDTSDEWVEKFTSVINSMETDLLQKLVVLQKTKSIASGLKEARTDCLIHIEQRKRHIMEALEEAYLKIQLSAKAAYDNLEKEAENAATAAERIELSLAGARSYAQRLVQSRSACDIFDQQRIVRHRLTALSNELDKLTSWVSSSSAVVVDSSLPENVEHVVTSWIGVPRLENTGHRSSGSSSSSPSPRPVDPEARPENETAASHSGTPSPASESETEFDTIGSVQLPVDTCLDVSPTDDGRLLLAVGRDGLIELNSTGDVLSRWHPPLGPAPPHCGGGWPGRDEVCAVTALRSERRVAVALYWSRAVLVLSWKGRSGKSAVDDTWVEYLRLSALPWRPQRLSAHGDFIAASGYLRWGTLLLDEDSEQVKVGRISDGDRRPWGSELSLEYRTCGMTLTRDAVFTASSRQVSLSCGSRAHVLDAHQLYTGCSFGGRLWRHDHLCSGDEEVKDVCADSADGVLYAAVCRTDASGGRLVSISMEDGSELQRVALSFVPRPEQPLLLPLRLSLGDGANSGTCCCVLAVLCCNPAAEQRQTVTVHRRR